MPFPKVLENFQIQRSFLRDFPEEFDETRWKFLQLLFLLPGTHVGSLPGNFQPGTWLRCKENFCQFLPFQDFTAFDAWHTEGKEQILSVLWSFKISKWPIVRSPHQLNRVYQWPRGEVSNKNLYCLNTHCQGSKFRPKYIDHRVSCLIGKKQWV